MPERPPPPCRLYLAVPPDIEPGALVAALEAGEIACVLLRGDNLDDDALRLAAARLCPLAQQRGVAFLLEDRAELAAALACDGVHLSDPAAYRRARQCLGPDAIVGVACGASRHDAMVASENDADYVAFGALGPEPAPPEDELVSWWQIMMTVPCVALGARSAAECAALAAAGADFVALGSWVWEDPNGPAAAIRAAAKALSEGPNGRFD